MRVETTVVLFLIVISIMHRGPPLLAERCFPKTRALRQKTPFRTAKDPEANIVMLATGHSLCLFLFLCVCVCVRVCARVRIAYCLCQGCKLLLVCLFFRWMSIRQRHLRCNLVSCHCERTFHGRNWHCPHARVLPLPLQRQGAQVDP